MGKKNVVKRILDDDYHGNILNEKYSGDLKKRLAEHIETFRAFDESVGVAMPYISAWQKEKEDIWYEFSSRDLIGLLGCSDLEVAGIFKERIIDRRIYKYQDLDSGVVKDVIGRQGLNDIRDKLREETQKTGILEAVYKISHGENGAIWLKDMASLEIYDKDEICLSLGFLMDVSKEMEVEEERERLVIELQEALGKVKKLSGLLPICSSCKKVRDDKGYWQEVEEYMRDHFEADFRHGICPDCVEKEIKEFEQLDKK